MNRISGASMANNRLSRLAACLLIGLGGCSSLLAQYELKSGVYNGLSQRIPATNPGKIAPVGPNGTPTGDPAITPQYSNVVESSASAGPIASGYPKSSNGTKLILASVGTSFASGVPRYFYGDQIVPPVAYIDSGGNSVPVATPATFWRAEPVAAGEVLTNPSGAPATDARTGASHLLLQPARQGGVCQHPGHGGGDLALQPAGCDQQQLYFLQGAFQRLLGDVHPGADDFLDGKKL
jgi:hypothetical protein